VSPTATPLRRKLVFTALTAVAALAALDLLGRLVFGDPRELPASGEQGVAFLSDPTAPILEELAPGTFTFARDAGEASIMFREQTWTSPPDPADFRVITVGDSTVYGPFPDALAAGLVVPSRTVELLNFGANGSASDRTRNVARAAVGQRPDLLVVYVGHNEVMESRRDPASLRPFWRRALRSHVRHSGVGRALSRLIGPLVRRLTPPPPPPPAEMTWPAHLCGAVDDDDWAVVGASYRRNLSALAADARAAGVTVALVEPVSSLQRSDDVPVAAQVADPALAGVTEGLQACRDGRAAEALARGDQLASQFPDLGEPQLLRGHALLALGRPDDARTALTDARRREIHPTRASDRHATVLREVAAAEGAVFVPVDDTFVADARYLAADDPLFIDEMHPSPAGNILLARAVIEGLTAVLPEGSRYDASRVDPSRLTGPGPRGFRPR